MDIVNPQPIVIPAVAEKIYDGLWIQTLNITAIEPGKPIQLTVRMVPYSNPDKIPFAGEVLKSEAKIIRIEDLLADAQTNPDIIQAMATVFAVLNSRVNATTNTTTTLPA